MTNPDAATGAARPHSGDDAAQRAVSGGSTRSGQPLPWWKPALVGLLSTTVTMVESWNPSLSTDEASTISAARRSLGDLWRMIHTIDVVHALYYAVMHFWTGLFGISPVSLRLPSAILVGVAAVGVFTLGHRLGGSPVAVLGAAVFTGLPRVSWFGVDARSYALTAALAVWTTVVLLSALEAERDRRGRSRWVRWILYSALVVACTASNVYVALLCGGHLVSLVLDGRVSARERWRWLVFVAIGGIVSAPVLLEASRQTGQIGGQSLHWSELIRNAVVNQWFLGDTPTTATGQSRTTIAAGDIGSWWQPAAVALACLGWLIIGYGAYRAVRDPEQLARSARASLVWLVPWCVLPTVVIGVYSVLVHPLYGPRYLSFATPAIALLLVGGVIRIRATSFRRTVISLLILAALPVYVSQRQVYAKSSSDFVTVADYIAAHKRAGDGVYFSPRYPAAGAPVGQSTRGIATAYPQAFAGLQDLTLQETGAEAGNLTGLSRLLSDSMPQLTNLHTVWVIRRFDYPSASLASDDALLAVAGFQGAAVWRGPLDSVIRFTRR